MLDSPMIDVALGLMLFFLVMSLFVTSVQGWLTNILGLRGKNLRRGIENLTDHKITKDIYDHPLMKRMGQNPSYLKSEYFAKIFIDVIDKKASLKEENDKEKSNIKGLIDQIENKDLKKAFQTLNIKTNDKIEEIEEKISNWFDTGMERASGWYQKKMRNYSIVISAVLVISINADTLNIAKALFNDDALRAKTSAIVDQISKETPKTSEEQTKLLENLETQIKVTDFPIGWSKNNFSWEKVKERTEWCWFYHFLIILLSGIIFWLLLLLVKKPVFCWKEVIEKVKSFSWKTHVIKVSLYGVIIWSMIIIFWSSILGYLITISAISLGAPFWFDLIGKVANIRNSIKPKEKETKNG